jgi:WD40 repeat protein
MPPGSLGESLLEKKPKYDVFLSHATPDKPVVEELARILTNRGFSPWLDKWNLIPGDPWQEAIERALEDCAACAVCIGPSRTGPWQIEEMRAAIDQRVSDRSRQFRVIPVLLPGSERGEPSRYPTFLRATTWVEFRETLDDEKALHRLISGIQGIPPGPDPGEAVAEGARPYRGLQVFDVGDALFFFGREALTEWLLDKLRADRSGSRFLAIVGPSGSGKSSLARAGLLASLKRGEVPGSDSWPVAVCKPGSEPLQSLSLAFAKAFRLSDASIVLNLSRDLLADPCALHVATHLHLSLSDAPADRRLVVLVDQFEEVFTLCPDEAQRRAIIGNLLHAATAADGQTVVVLTLRADFYGRCAAYPDLAAAVSDRQSLVGPMTGEELRSAIERPAYLAGCELEGGLADLLLNEVESQPGSLPLLEHALLQIWDRKEGGRRLTIDAYREVGGVAGALERHAEEVYAGFSQEEKETCRRIFLRLVQVDDQGRVTKQRLGLDEIAPSASPAETVVACLTDARLLTTDREKQRTVELAHEALLSNWDRLKQWTDQDREALRTRRRLDEALAEWHAKQRDPSFLLEGGRLAQVEEWAKNHPEEVTPDRQEHLTASLKARDRERRRLRNWTIAAATVAVLALAIAGIALYLQKVAEMRRRLVVANELSARARTVSAGNPQLGLLLAAEALRIAQSAGDPYLPEPQSALRASLAVSSGTPLPTGPVVNSYVMPDRRTLVTIGEDHHLRLWDLQTEKFPFPDRDLGKLGDSTGGMAGSPTGGWLLVEEGKALRLIDLTATPRPMATSTTISDESLPSGPNPFSPDGQWLATWKHGELVLRNLKRSVDPQAYPTPDHRLVATFTFSPDSRELAISSLGGDLVVWDLTSTPPKRGMYSHGVTVMSMAFNQDQQVFAAAAFHQNGGLSLLSIDRNGTINKTDTGTKSPTGGFFRDNGKLKMFFNDNKTTTLTNPESTLNPLPKDTWPFIARTFDQSPDKHWRTMTDSEGSIYIQQYEPTPSAPILLSRRPAECGVDFSFNSKWLVTERCGEIPRIWNLNAESLFQELGLLFAPGAIVTDNGSLIYDDQISRILARSGLGGARFSASSIFHRPRLHVSADKRWTIDLTHQKIVNLKPDGTIALQVPFNEPIDYAFIFSAKSRWLASCGRTGLTLRDLRNLGYKPRPITERFCFVVAFAPNETLLASAALTSEVSIRRLREYTSQLVDNATSFVSNVPRVLALGFSPQGEWLAVGGEGERLQVRRESGQSVFLESRDAGIAKLVFSSDGKWLAAGGSYGGIQLWRWEGTKTNPAPILLSGHTELVNSIGFSPRGILSAAADGTVRFWELDPKKRNTSPFPVWLRAHF